MNTSIISDAFSDLSRSSIHTPDIAIPDFDTEALVGWTRRVLPFVSPRSNMRRNLVSLGIIAVVAAAVAYFVVNRKGSEESDVAESAADGSIRRVA